VPPDDISSFYSYQKCVVTLSVRNGTECVYYSPTIMDVLTITPPFFYSYQCGSTLLISYIPVHMYSISLQVLFTIVTLVIIFSSSDRAHQPSWLLSLLPGVCWPSHWQSVGGSTVNLDKKPTLISPHRIISGTMDNVILLLSFGLCSPVLCVWIAVSICLHLLSWLVLIGRFVSARMNALNASGESSPSTKLDEGWLHFFCHLFLHLTHSL
jgi:hypothetical protein